VKQGHANATCSQHSLLPSPLALQGDNVHEPNYGCKAVQAEWEFSGQRSLMARECMHKLARRVQVRQASHCQLPASGAQPCSSALLPAQAHSPPASQG
jgi:hypothetical protein